MVLRPSSIIRTLIKFVAHDLCEAVKDPIEVEMPQEQEDVAHYDQGKCCSNSDAELLKGKHALDLAPDRADLWRPCRYTELAYSWVYKSMVYDCQGLGRLETTLSYNKRAAVIRLSISVLNCHTAPPVHLEAATADRMQQSRLVHSRVWKV